MPSFTQAQKLRLRSDLDAEIVRAGIGDVIAEVLPEATMMIIEGFDPARRDASRFQSACRTLLNDSAGLFETTMVLCRLLAAPVNPVAALSTSYLGGQALTEAQLRAYGLTDAIEIIMLLVQGNPERARNRLQQYSVADMLTMFVSVAAAVHHWYTTDNQAM